MTDRLRPLSVLLLGGRVRLGCLLVLSAIEGVITALPAWALGYLVNAISRPDGAVTQAILTLAAVTVAAGVGPHVTGFVGLSLNGRIAVRMQERIADAMLEPVGVEHLVDPTLQERAFRSRQAATSAPNYLLDVVTTCIGAVFTTATYAGILLRIWPWMAVLLVVTAVPLAFLQRAAARHTIRHSVDADRADRWSRYYLDAVSDHRVGKDIRLFNAGAFLAGRLHESLERSRLLQMKAFALNFTAQSALVTVNALVAAAGTWGAAQSVSDRQTSLGDFVLFITAVIVLQNKLTVTMTMLGGAGRSSQLVKDYHAVTADAPPPHSMTGPAHAPGELVFEDVWFRYSNDTPWVLRGASLSVQPGETAVIFGENGSGKSTILALTLRLFQPTAGRITLGRNDIQDLDATAFRKRITGVLQDFTQFELSVRDNILLSAAHSTTDDDRLTDLAARSAIGDVIEGLPHSWDTLLSRQREVAEGVSGVELSGGQRQKLALLRALWRSDAQLVLLDEMTSALDYRAEAYALATVVSQFATAAKLVVSHRPAAGLHAHKVLFVQDGHVDVVWQGSPGDFKLDRFEELWLSDIAQRH